MTDSGITSSRTVQENLLIDSPDLALERAARPTEADHLITNESQFVRMEVGRRSRPIEPSKRLRAPRGS